MKANLHENRILKIVKETFTKNIIFYSLFFVVCFLFSFQIQAQDNSQKPKIGLVLSGGGAKGLAHIGVLKVIDSLGIKIDYIGGTSMGAIIGGLYASGYSGEELDSLFREVDTDALLQDYTPRESKTFYEKRNDEIYAFSLPFNNFRLELPKALSKGLYNYHLISRLTKHVSYITDFDKLPIPFLCIATDVETGQEVVLEKGTLPKALLASGAIPTLYNPIQIDGKMLIDGGVVNNYPVEELLKKGADIIIGVDVQDGLKKLTDIKGATGVLSQVTNFSMIEKMDKKRELTTIYIKPNIKGYTVVSFEKGGEIVEKGEKEARIHLKELIPLQTQYKRPAIQKEVSKLLYITDLEINNLDKFTRAYVVGKLKFNSNSRVEYKTVERGINNLNATQNFESIFYYFKKNHVGEKLVIDVAETKKNTFLKFGLHYDGLLKSALLLNVTRKNLLIKNDVFSLDVGLGDNFRYNLNYYVDNGFYLSYGFTSKYVGLNRNLENDFSGNDILSSSGLNSLNIDFSDFSNQAYVQTIFAQKFSLGVGVELKHLKIESQTVIENVDPIIDDSDYFSLFGFLKYDSFDNKYFPKRGWYFVGDLKPVLYSSDRANNFEKFTIAKADGAIAFTLHKKFTFKLQSEGGFSIGENRVPYLDFALGGYGFTQINNLRPFLGYDFVALSGNSYVKGSVVLDYEVFKKNHLNFTANYANIGNNIFDNGTWIEKPMYSGYGFGYGLETLIGPIEIKHSWSPETRDHHTWFSIGFTF